LISYQLPPTLFTMNIIYRLAIVYFYSAKIKFDHVRNNVTSGSSCRVKGYIIYIIMYSWLLRCSTLRPKFFRQPKKKNIIRPSHIYIGTTKYNIIINNLLSLLFVGVYTFKCASVENRLCAHIFKYIYNYLRLRNLRRLFT